MLILWLGCVCLILVLALCSGDILSSMPKVALEVLSPRGEIEPPKSLGLSPRLSRLEGKTIGLYDIGKDGFSNFLDVMEKS